VSAAAAVALDHGRKDWLCYGANPQRPEAAASPPDAYLVLPLRFLSLLDPHHVCVLSFLVCVHRLSALVGIVALVCSCGSSELTGRTGPDTPGSPHCHPPLPLPPANPPSPSPAGSDVLIFLDGALTQSRDRDDVHAITYAYDEQKSTRLLPLTGGPGIGRPDHLMLFHRSD
jgi:hypothetical protein